MIDLVFLTSSCLLFVLAAAEVLEIIQVLCAARADCAGEKSGQARGEDLSALVSESKQSDGRRKKSNTILCGPPQN